MTINQSRGYLYEILIAHLLEQNNFARCQKGNKLYKCGVSSVDGEVLGRGTHHQIDFVGVYEKNIPFIYPIRLLAECKFWTSIENNSPVYKPVTKSFIREYIGVYKDISENYFSLHMKKYTRFLDVPIVFSAGGFDNEAEKLAWAHGINIVSHSKIPIMRDILDFINSLVLFVPEEYFTEKRKFNRLKEIVSKVIRGVLPEEMHREIRLFINHIKRTSTDFEENTNSLISLLNTIRNTKYNTFLFATTEHGKLINLISYATFPDELFSQQESQDCAIYFNDPNVEDEERKDRVFYIELNNDRERRRFYFQANKEMMLEDFSRLSLRDRINTKERYFKKLSIMKEINELTRLITINVNFENIMNEV